MRRCACVPASAHVASTDETQASTRAGRARPGRAGTDQPGARRRAGPGAAGKPARAAARGPASARQARAGAEVPAHASVAPAAVGVRRPGAGARGGLRQGGVSLRLPRPDGPQGRRRATTRTAPQPAGKARDGRSRSCARPICVGGGPPATPWPPSRPGRASTCGRRACWRPAVATSCTTAPAGAGTTCTAWRWRRPSARPGPSATAAPIACGDRRASGYIDPAVLVHRGRAYLYFSVDGPRHSISVLRLSRSLLRAKGPRRTLFGASRPWHRSPAGQTVEAPWPVRRGRRFYLFYSAGCWCSDYRMGLASAPTPLGPYRDARANPFLRGSAGMVAPGGGSVVAGPDGRPWLVVPRLDRYPGLRPRWSTHAAGGAARLARLAPAPAVRAVTGLPAR